MSILTIPLDKNKDVAELVAEKQPGDRLYACFTIKAKDDQTLTVRLEEVTDKTEDLPTADEYEEEKKENEESEEMAGEDEDEEILP
jgi:hypothetical protein